MRILYIAGIVLLVIIVIKVLGIDVNHMFDQFMVFLNKLIDK